MTYSVAAGNGDGRSIIHSKCDRIRIDSSQLTEPLRLTHVQAILQSNAALTIHQ